MIFDWSNYLLVAEYLPPNLPTEASYRSSISRSYYSVFHKARIFCLNKLGIITENESKGRSCHIIMSERLIEEDDLELLEISQKISALRERRKKADYDTYAVINPFLANDTIIKSKEVIALMVDYNP